MSRRALWNVLQPDLSESIQKAIMDRVEREGVSPDSILREAFWRGWSAPGPRYCGKCGTKMQ